jgi:outer membrane receptor protein involved in Fe transport
LIAVRPANPAYLSTVYPNLVFVPPNARAANWAGTFLDPALGVTNPTTGASVPGTAQLDTVIPFGDRHFIQAGLRTDCELSDDLTLTSLTSFDHYEQRQAMDTSGMQYAQTLLPNVDGHIDSFNQELRIANSQHNPLRWMLGANYENSITDEYQLQRYEHTAYNPAFLYINASGVTNHQHIENYAVFGNTEWSATSQLTLKAGVRWTSSNNSASICSSTIPGGNVDLLFNYLGSLLGSVPFTPIVIAQAPCFQGYHSALI